MLITSKLLVDKEGLEYIGGIVISKYIESNLSKLKGLLSNDFEKYIKKRLERDGTEHHITIVNPYEYKELDEKLSKSLIGINFEINLKELGSLTNGVDITYYVIAESEEINKVRSSVNLNKCYPHVTLGFWENDVHNKPKDGSTKI